MEKLRRSPTSSQQESSDNLPTAEVVVTVGVDSVPVTYFPGATSVRVGSQILAVGPSITTTVTLGGDILEFDGETVMLDYSEVSTTPIGTAAVRTSTTSTGQYSSPTVVSSTGQYSSLTVVSSTLTASFTSAKSTSASSTAQITSSVTHTPLAAVTPTTAPAPSTSRGQSLSAGGVAGIAFGCAIGGALIALILSFFLFRCKEKKRESVADWPVASGAKRSSRGSKLLRQSGVVELFADKKADRKSTSPSDRSLLLASRVNSILPPAAEDTQLEREMHQLHQKIHDHVGAYYSWTKVIAIPDEFFDFSSLGPPMKVPSASLTSLLSNEATRLPSVHLCIAWAVISRLRFESGVDTCLLPHELVGCLQHLRSEAVATEEGRLALHSRWRQLTANLVQAKYGPTAGAAPHTVRKAVNAVEDVLHPLADDRQAEAARRASLKEILEHGARFGLLLMAQPAVYEMNWNNVTREKGTLVIFPALIQVAGEDGVKQYPPKVLTLPDVVRGLRF